MIKKLHEEWERLSQEARQTAEGDPRRHQEIVDRMNAVSGALKKMSQSSVTRTTVSQAVRDALGEILKSDRETLFPELPRLREELTGLRESIDRGLAELRQRSDGAENGLEARDSKSATDLGHLNARLGELEGVVSQRLERVEGRMAVELGSAEGKNGEGVLGITRRLDREIEGLRLHLGQALEEAQARWAVRTEPASADLERKLAERVDQLGTRLEALARDSAGLGKAVGGDVDRLVQAQNRRLGELSARLESVTRDAADRTGALAADLGRKLEAFSTDLASRGGDLSARLTTRVEQVSSGLERRIQEIEARLKEQSAKVGSLAQELASADDNLAEGLKDLEGRLGRRLTGLEAATASRNEAVEAGLRQSLAAAETRLSEAHDQLEARFTGELQSLSGRIGLEVTDRITRLEAALPELRAMEARLRKEMGMVMEQLEDKVNSLVDMVGQIQSGLPPRQLFEGLDDRLGHIETRFRTVSDQLDELEVTVPEIRSLGEQIQGVRGDVSGLAGELSSSGKEFRDMWDLFARRVQDMQDLLRSGVERWEADRSNLRQRLVDLRDTMRDQLQLAAQKTEAGAASLWNKILARPEGGLRLDLEEWERFRTRLETIVQGLETLLTESK